jgi:hypothetical protein
LGAPLAVGVSAEATPAQALPAGAWYVQLESGPESDVGIVPLVIRGWGQSQLVACGAPRGSIEFPADRTGVRLSLFAENEGQWRPLVGARPGDVPPRISLTDGRYLLHCVRGDDLVLFTRVDIAGGARVPVMLGPIPSCEVTIFASIGRGSGFSLDADAVFYVPGVAEEGIVVRVGAGGGAVLRVPRGRLAAAVRQGANQSPRSAVDAREDRASLALDLP